MSPPLDLWEGQLREVNAAVSFSLAKEQNPERWELLADFLHGLECALQRLDRLKP